MSAPSIDVGEAVVVEAVLHVAEARPAWGHARAPGVPDRAHVVIVRQRDDAEEIVAVGRAGRDGIVRFPIGAQVRAGDIVRVRAWPPSLAPSKGERHEELSVRLHGGPVVDEGAGVAGWFDARWTTEAPLEIRAYASPLARFSLDGASAQLGAAGACAAWDHAGWQLGGCVGASKRTYDADDTDGTAPEIGVVARAGSRDGVRVEIQLGRMLSPRPEALATDGYLARQTASARVQVEVAAPLGPDHDLVGGYFNADAGLQAGWFGVDLRLPTVPSLDARLAVGRADVHAHPRGKYVAYSGAWLMTGFTVRVPSRDP